MRISNWSSYVCSSDLAASGGETAIVSGNPVGRKSGRRLCAIDGGLVLSWQEGRDRTAGDPGAAPLIVRFAEIGDQAGAVLDRKSVGSGKSVSVSVDLGGCRIIKKNK